MRSIRARLAIGLMGSLALVLGAGGALLYFRTKASLERQDDALLLSKSWALAASVRVDGGETRFDPAPALAADFERADRHAAYEIRRGDGSLLACSPSLQSQGLELLAHEKIEPLRSPSIAGEPVFSWTALREGEPARELRLQLPVWSENPEDDRQATGAASRRGGAAAREATASGERAAVRESSASLSSMHAGSGTNSSGRHLRDEFSIRVVEEMPETRAALADLRSTILIVITLAFLMSILLVHFVLLRGLSPLEAMAVQAQKIDAESLDRRFSKEPLPVELEPIRTRLNDLLDRLEQSFERERRFNAAVAHELRTPIAELRTLSEIALRWPESADTQKNMSDVSAVAQEMQSVIEALLTLRRVESGAEEVELEPVRADEVVRSTLATYGKAAAARNQTLEVGVVADTTIDSHPHMLRSIVSNLVSNAIEYAPEGATIRIVCRADDGGFRFSTENPAPDLTPEDVPHLFEAFWRKDAVRTTGSHAGLGLTLTQSLAKVLGLGLRAELGDDGSLRMILEAR